MVAELEGTQDALEGMAQFLEWAKSAADALDPCEEIVEQLRSGEDPVDPDAWDSDDDW